MDITTANIIQIASYLITLGIFIGTVKTQYSSLNKELLSHKELFTAQQAQLSIQISSLEKKVEKHNQVVERTYRCEESLKSAHHRIDELRAAK